MPRSSSPTPVALAAPLALLGLLVLLACGGGATEPVFSNTGHPLDHMDTALLEIRGETFFVWLARTPDERAQGLMGLDDDGLTPQPDGTERGMLFVWSVDTLPSFWMRDTTVALDLAYVREDGTITEVFALEPLDETPVPASTPVRYALEVRRGVLAARGIEPGDVVSIPPDVDI